MRAVVFDEFGATPEVRTVPDPDVSPDGAVVEVESTGLCRSDWHTWQGHESEVALPHVAGHELAGRLVEVGSLVRGWHPGQRVTVPFVCACGTCHQCATGNQQVCAHQFQPGVTHWGSFAERVAVRRAETNLVALPDELTSTPAAALGCRFATAFRAVLRQGEVRAGQWVAVHGCGG
ncbi:alcohol dehydrogenase catalytic domain-containing protein, partial [Actinopolyspora mortivallis]